MTAENDEQRNSDSHPRRHPLFPTYAEVAQNPELAYSDHLPILTSVPFSDHASIQIFSLNMLGPCGLSGLHQVSQWENDSQQQQRYLRIAKGIAKAVKKHNVSIICLQEVNPPEIIIPQLKEMLDDEWEVIEALFSENEDKDETGYSYIKSVGMITLVNREKHTIMNYACDGRNQVTSVSIKMNDKHTNTLSIHNIWGRFDPFPDQLEALCHKKLTEDSSKVSVIIGDTNSRIAPLDDKPRNITTGLVPYCFNKRDEVSDNVQVPDYPDGGFYRDEEGFIHQLDVDILDFSTGDIVHDTRDQAKLEIWNEFRMIMCLDQCYQEEFLDKKNLFEYEENLKRNLMDDKLMVRIAANSFNQKAVALRFPMGSPLFARLQSRFESIAGVLIKKLDSTSHEHSGKPFQCIFIPKTVENLKVLKNLIQAFANVLKLEIIEALEKRINELRCKKQTENVVSKIEMLEQIILHTKGMPNESRSDDFLKTLNQLEESRFVRSRNINEASSKKTYAEIIDSTYLFFSSTQTRNTIDGIKEYLKQMREYFKPYQDGSTQAIAASSSSN